MSDTGNLRRQLVTGRRSEAEFIVHSDDRLRPLPTKDADDNAHGKRSWSTRVLTFCAYFAPAGAVALPLGTPNRGMIAAAVVGLGSATFAFFRLDRNDKHRPRLMIVGTLSALVFFYFVAKSWLKT